MILSFTLAAPIASAQETVPPPPSAPAGAAQNVSPGGVPRPTPRQDFRKDVREINQNARQEKKEAVATAEKKKQRIIRVAQDCYEIYQLLYS